VENSYDVINLFSAEGELIYTSPSVKRVLGYDPEELIGTKGPILIHPDEIEDALQTFAEYVDKPNATGHFVHRLRHNWEFAISDIKVSC
jgi:PAS domain S-box-containing protein